jgi:hypothetical protein
MTMWGPVWRNRQAGRFTARMCVRRGNSRTVKRLALAAVPMMAGKLGKTLKA